MPWGASAPAVISPLDREQDDVEDDAGERGAENAGRQLLLAARVEERGGDDSDQRQQEAGDVGGDRDVALFPGVGVDAPRLVEQPTHVVNG
jgi:hypothetical protein